MICKSVPIVSNHPKDVPKHLLPATLGSSKLYTLAFHKLKKPRVLISSLLFSSLCSFSSASISQEQLGGNGSFPAELRSECHDLHTALEMMISSKNRRHIIWKKTSHGRSAHFDISIWWLSWILKSNYKKLKKLKALLP